MKKHFILFFLVCLGIQSVEGTSNPVNPSQDKPVRLYVQHNTIGMGFFSQTDGTSDDASSHWQQLTYQSYNHNWTDGAVGGGSIHLQDSGSCSPSVDGWPYLRKADAPFSWPATNWPHMADGTYTLTGTNWDAWEMFDWSDGSGIWGRPVDEEASDFLTAFEEHCVVNMMHDYDYSGDGVVVKTHNNYHRTADTEWHLQTGGKALSHRQNLFCISSSASAISDCLEMPGWPLADPATMSVAGYLMIYDRAISTAIPSKNITIDGMAVGSDGKQWRTYADNDDRDVTPRVKNKDFYTFTVGQQKYELTIKANGNDLSVTNPEFCVGQKVTFDVEGLPDATTTTYAWAFSSKFVNHAWQLTNIWGSGYGSVNYDTDLGLLTNAETYAWWYSGGNKNTYLNAHLHFSNGQSAVVSVSGQFSMYRPSVIMLTKDINGTPMNVWNTPWNFADFGDIGLGVESKTNEMYYNLQVISTEFSAGLGGGSGGAKITQLCTIDAEKGAGYGLYNVPVYVTNALDGSDPYSAGTAVIKTNNPPSNMNLLPLDDAPGTGGYTSFHYFSSFTDYVMFCPDGGIYVPLGKITWGTAFAAVWPSTTMLTNSVSGPTGPDGSYDFPVWTSTFSP